MLLGDFRLTLTINPIMSPKLVPYRRSKNTAACFNITAKLKILGVAVASLEACTWLVVCIKPKSRGFSC
jgi:hypothetical protein